MQNYGNHRRLDPVFHVVVTLLTLAGLVTAIIHLVQAIGEEHGVFGAVVLLLLALSAAAIVSRLRTYPIRAQDRAIRAEEQLRHYVLTGKLLPSALTVGQIVALRFASDEELPALAERAAKEKLKSNDIKKAIKNWRADTYRV